MRMRLPLDLDPTRRPVLAPRGDQERAFGGQPVELDAGPPARQRRIRTNSQAFIVIPFNNHQKLARRHEFLCGFPRVVLNGDPLMRAATSP